MKTDRIAKCASPRDAVLFEMATLDWANEHSGRIDSPTGVFYRLCNVMDDVWPISDAFGPMLDELGLGVSDIIGNFVLTEDELAFVDVTEYPTAVEALRAYRELDSQFKDWMSETDGGRKL